MDILSQRARLGILVVLDVALAENQPLQARVFAARHNLPPRHLESMLQAFVHERILKGVRGPLGGYRLGQPREHITLGEIVRTVAKLTTAGPDTYSAGSALINRVIAPCVERAAQPLLEMLNARTIADLCARASSLGLAAKKIKVDAEARGAGREAKRPPSLTLNEMRAQGVRSVRTQCAACGHQSDFGVDPLDGDVRVADLARRMRCLACGGKKIETRPAWREG